MVFITYTLLTLSRLLRTTNSRTHHAAFHHSRFIPGFCLSVAGQVLLKLPGVVPSILLSGFVELSPLTV